MHVKQKIKLSCFSFYANIFDKFRAFVLIVQLKISVQKLTIIFWFVIPLPLPGNEISEQSKVKLLLLSLLGAMLENNSPSRS